MRKLIALLSLLLIPTTARAEAPAGDVLSDDEGALMCAEALPKELECKKEFCAAMVRIRTKGNPKADLAAMESKCQAEIAVDGTGELSVRKDRCAGWIKNRPKMSVTRGDVKAMDACWTQATCQARIDCWAPKMAKLMDAAASRKK